VRDLEGMECVDVGVLGWMDGWMVGWLVVEKTLMFVADAKREERQLSKSTNNHSDR
jgi:hypothetical protein